ncbi:MAG: nickel-dependent hydrogenase large subunit [SAR324 cluster bacterium]|nr:nickel-dependent hydrogenase large subunit [SAR324 cluster bacterium]MBF0352496.1 nickel-dependent hydrogenase large subunit [SAR324 cluster bacterium]
MASKRIVIDPLTRIEGHLKIATQVENGIVVEAKASAEMFRGIEKALIGYDARVAQQVTQRVCGVCPYAHAEAAGRALEMAMGITPNTNGKILRNLINGAYQLQDYLLHFYHLCALDFIDITACLKYEGRDETLLGLKAWVQSELKNREIFPAAPFLPRYKAAYCTNQELNVSAIKHYVEALPVMADFLKMVCIFGGKAPHPITIEAGGVTTVPSVSMIAHYQTIFEKSERFIKNEYFNDLVGVAKEFKTYFKEGRGYGNLLSYPHFFDKDGNNPIFSGGSLINGVYSPLDVNQIQEDMTFSYYQTTGSAQTKPLAFDQLIPISEHEFENEQKKESGKYSWSRAPRYKGEVVEVGPVARVVTTYKSGKNPKLNALVDKINSTLGISLEDYPSVMGRHLCRYISATLTIDLIREQLDQLEPGKVAFVEHDVPQNARGYGLTEASRGALAHWIETDDRGYIKNYEMIVPTTWNISPRDSSGRPGAVEQMLLGTKVQDSDNPVELARIVRSTDPCLACAVH